MKTKFSCTRFLLHWPIRKLVHWGQSYLSKALLVTCEVAMEYMLALTYSPQVWSLFLTSTLADCLPIRRPLLQKHAAAPDVSSMSRTSFLLSCIGVKSHLGHLQRPVQV